MPRQRSECVSKSGGGSGRQTTERARARGTTGLSRSGRFSPDNRRAKFPCQCQCHRVMRGSLSPSLPSAAVSIFLRPLLHGKRREEEPGTNPHRNQHTPYYAQQRYLCFLDYGCVRYVFGLSDNCSQSAPVPNSSSIDGTPAQCGWLVCLWDTLSIP